MIAALFRVFTNPVAPPPLLYLWTFAGFLGGLIAGGKIRRGFLVGMTVYLSTLGALGLAALAIYQNVNLSTLSSLPSPPPGFSIISATTGPVAGDIIPILIQGASPTSQMIIQDVILTKLRSCPPQQLRRKQSLTLHNQQQPLAVPRHQFWPPNTKLHPRTILTTRPDHILHRRPVHDTSRIR